MFVVFRIFSIKNCTVLVILLSLCGCGPCDKHPSGSDILRWYPEFTFNSNIPVAKFISYDIGAMYFQYLNIDPLQIQNALNQFDSRLKSQGWSYVPPVNGSFNERAYVIKKKNEKYNGNIYNLNALDIKKITACGSVITVASIRHKFSNTFWRENNMSDLSPVDSLALSMNDKWAKEHFWPSYQKDAQLEVKKFYEQFCLKNPGAPDCQKPPCE